MSMNEYSAKEIALVRHYFPDSADAFLENSGITAYPLYRMMVEEAFVRKECFNKFSNSLRRCMEALRDCKIYRMTPEFDALIDDGVLQ